MKQTKIFAEVLEHEALDQFNSAIEQPFAVQGALMPDAHAGYSLPIGAVVATDNVILPAWVGYDIGCGMCALPLTYSGEQIRERAQDIFHQIYRDIPVGFAHNQEDTPWEHDIPMSAKVQQIFAKNGLRQLGSLGGGNHFIEIGEDQHGEVWIIIHSGSRGIGHAVATHYMREASGDGKAREGHFGFYADSDYGTLYRMDLEFCLAFALENRKEMMRRIVGAIHHVLRDGNNGADWDRLINRNHNHAELKDGLWIHRKGATHAEEGMMGVIPGNMRDGSFIVRGKGNPDALWSSSHGAGRVLGRKEAMRTLNLDDFKATMTKVVAKVDHDTLDESPFAYKDIFEVMRLQADLVEVVAHVRPIINIKG